MSSFDWVNDPDEEIEKKIKNGNFNHDMLMSECYYARTNVIKFMKKENYIDREVVNQPETLSGYCPLYNAVLSGSAEMVEMLVELGADVNKLGERQHVIALHLAASLGNTEIVKTLVAHGAKVDAELDGGITPLHLAAYGGKIETIEALIELGANVNAQDKNGETVLHLAKRGGFPEVVKVLIKNGAGKKKSKAKAPANKKKLSHNKKFEEYYLNFLSVIKMKARSIL